MLYLAMFVVTDSAINSRDSCVFVDGSFIPIKQLHYSKYDYHIDMLHYTQTIRRPDKRHRLAAVIQYTVLIYILHRTNQ